MRKSHPDSVLNLKGPKFDSKRHALAGSATCCVCRQSFSFFFYLRKHVEASTCPRVELLHRQQEELPTETLANRDQANQLQAAAAAIPKRPPETRLSLHSLWKAARSVGSSYPVKKERNNILTSSTQMCYEQAGETATSEASAV